MIENNQIHNAPRRIPHRYLYGVAILIAIVGLVQFGRFLVSDFRLDNPTVTHSVNWNSPETKRLWNQTCADCHSNETSYPWYSYIAPVGWLVAHDVHEGRDTLNISVSDRVELDEMIEVIQEGEMPLPVYTLMHPEARLSDVERQVLINGLRATFAETAGLENSNDD